MRRCERGDGALRRDEREPDGDFHRPDRRTLCVWQPREHIGAQMSRAGRLTWNELHTPTSASRVLLQRSVWLDFDAMEALHGARATT